MDIGRHAKIILFDDGQPVMVRDVEYRNADGTKADFGPWPPFPDSFPESVTFRLTVDPDEPNGFNDWFAKMEAAFWGLAKTPSLSPEEAARARRRAARKRQRLARKITRKAVSR